MSSRAAMLLGALLGAALAGCQNAPQQLSIYAPFGPAVVPTPSLTRANSTPYYTPPADASAAPGSSPATASSAGNNTLSHYDPYRGLLVPGNFSPSPVAVRTDETWGARDAALAAAPRERASNEEPIRIVEGSSSAFAAQGSSRSSSGSSTLSGAVKPTLGLPPPPTGESAADIATRPRSPASSTPASPLAPGTLPAANPPGLLAPPPANSNPAAPRPLSLWDSPRDGSRVMPASHLEESRATTPASGSWRVRD